MKEGTRRAVLATIMGSPAEEISRYHAQETRQARIVGEMEYLPGCIVHSSNHDTKYHVVLRKRGKGAIRVGVWQLGWRD